MLDHRLHLIESATIPDSREDAPRPTRMEAEAAVRTLIRWAGDSPRREGVLDTPARVVRAYEEWFGGYALDPEEILARDFDSAGYDDIVMLRDIPLRSMCEHHMAAIRGVAHVAYLPGERVVGISKLARLVDAYGRRLQIQERLTTEIAQTLERVLRPRGVAVVVQASHECISSRGIGMHGVNMVTRKLLGAFTTEPWRGDILAAFGLDRKP
jgi:GTP cyclohydrolase I